MINEISQAHRKIMFSLTYTCYLKKKKSLPLTKRSKKMVIRDRAKDEVMQMVVIDHKAMFHLR